jgi:hypothetical protein
MDEVMMAGGAGTAGSTGADTGTACGGGGRGIPLDPVAAPALGCCLASKRAIATFSLRTRNVRSSSPKN